MTRFAAPFTVLLLALVPVACGGGSDAPSKEEFVKNAEQICADAAKQLNDLGKANTPNEVADQLDKVIDETQKSVDDLTDLERPEGDAGEAAKKFVDALESDIEDKGIPALEKLRDAIKDKDTQAAQQAYQELAAIETTDSDKLAKELGANGCAD
jgi:hypothetical protein